MKLAFNLGTVKINDEAVIASNVTMKNGVEIEKEIVTAPFNLEASDIKFEIEFSAAEMKTAGELIKSIIDQVRQYDQAEKTKEVEAKESFISRLERRAEIFPEKEVI